MQMGQICCRFSVQTCTWKIHRGLQDYPCEWDLNKCHAHTVGIFQVAIDLWCRLLLFFFNCSMSISAAKCDSTGRRNLQANPTVKENLDKSWNKKTLYAPWQILELPWQFFVSPLVSVHLASSNEMPCQHVIAGGKMYRGHKNKIKIKAPKSA